MEEFIQQMIEKVGIDRATAEKVIAFLQEHAADLPALLGKAGGAEGLLDQAKGLFGNR
jgi:hypothetical protein